MTSSGANYDIPSWASKPPTGLHLDVLKDKKLIQKLMVDDKRCYLFGRNSQLNDFCIDHQSCSRVHAALVYHKHLKRAFLVDLGSTHGTYIGSVRLEGQKPTPLPMDSVFHFGASTRNYVIRERPQAGPRPVMEEIEKTSMTAEGGAEKGAALLGLPESETELDNLTEFNTAHNRRITMIGIPAEQPKKKRKIKLTFDEEEEVINPEDVDPSVGRFRNMVETTVIPKKRSHSAGPGLLGTRGEDSSAAVAAAIARASSGLPYPAKRQASHGSLTSPVKGGLYDGLDSLGISMPLPNPAPEIDMAPPPPPPLAPAAKTTLHAHAQFQHHPPDDSHDIEDPDEPKKKKYAKEAWPGKKPTPSLLV